MGFLSGIGDLLKQYSANSATPSTTPVVEQHNSPLAAQLQSGSVTPAQAANVSLGEVQALTAHAQNQDPSIIDRVSAIYAEHPVLIKSLGAAALTIAMKKIADQRAAETLSI
jgi:hypothetical protein